MQSKPKANSAITHAVNGATITFNVLGAGSVTLNMGLMHAANTAQAAIHGMIQRISDAAALTRTDAKGNIIPDAERAALKLERMTALVEHYESGSPEWSRVSAAGPSGGVLFKALCRMSGKSADEVRAFLDATSRTEQNALRASPDVAKVIREIEAEQAAAGPTVDTAALLGKIGL